MIPFLTVPTFGRLGEAPNGHFHARLGWAEPCCRDQTAEPASNRKYKTALRLHRTENT